MDLDQAQKSRQPSKVLIGDTAEQNLLLLKAVFAAAGYDVTTARDGEAVMSQAAETRPDVVIVDVGLHGIDGFGICARLKSMEASWALPVVLISSHLDPSETIKGIEAGANDFWHRPLHRADLLARTKAVLRAAQSRYNATSVHHAIVALAKAVEARDPYTRGHTERVAELAVKIGQALGLDGANLDFLRQGALLHDVGKVGVRDSVLLKIGPLSGREKVEIQAHPEIGENICRPLQARAIQDIVRSHHERYDGTGYPDGLAGETIPLVARIMAIADAYDAMTSNRPYHVSTPRKKALQTIAEEAGKHFDPQLVSVFLDVMKSAPPVKKRMVEGTASARPSLLLSDLPESNQLF